MSQPELLEFLVNLLGVILTLAVLSRIAGDNPVYKLALYLFAGTSLGLAFVVVYHAVLRPAALGIVTRGLDLVTILGTLVPLLLGVLLFTRLSGRQTISWMANIPLALIFGVGAALAFGGALAGTLLPQLVDTVRLEGGSLAALAGSGVLVLGVIFGLLRFTITVPADTARGRLIAAAGRIGHWLIMITFGVFFAAALSTYLAALSERVRFIVTWLLELIG